MEPVLTHFGMENLPAIWENFSLSESEGSKHQVCEKGYEGKFPLAARFFTDKSVEYGSHGSYLQTTLAYQERV